VFTNEGYDETVTLAQVFHQKDQTGQPDRFYITSDKSLSIETDFTDFGADLTDLRRRLRAGGAALFNNGEFPKYATSYRRMLGIKSDQAMELFHQTVSMKSVGNLNDFVRSHMLERIDATDRVRGIVAHFEDLTKAHEAVTRARDQLAALHPLVSTAIKYDEALERRTRSEQHRDALRLFITELRARLLTEEISDYDTTRSSTRAEEGRVEQELLVLEQEREALIEERAGAGGDRLSELERQATSARQEAKERSHRRTGFDDRVLLAGLSPVGDITTFAALTEEAAQARTVMVRHKHDLQEKLAEHIAERNELTKLGQETQAELTSLAQRTSNLPGNQVDVRAQLCADLHLEESELPFAGELLDVAEKHSEWRGAAERVLRGFALSLLVPQPHYANVTAWVNERRLTYRRGDGRVVGSRLVYERVAPRRVPLQHRPSHGALLLTQCLEIKDGPFQDFMRDELAKRADYVCVDSVAELRAEHRAVTREGQVRSGDRHDKDDRTRVDDPRNWVLGWMNERKIAALTDQLVEQHQRWAQAEAQCTSLQAELDVFRVKIPGRG
jgi:uncharacterized protein YPO0396